MTRRKQLTVREIDKAVSDGFWHEYGKGIELPLDSEAKFEALVANLKVSPGVRVTQGENGTYKVEWVNEEQV